MKIGLESDRMGGLLARSGPVATDEEIALEAARCRKLQRAVDVTVAQIHQSQDLSLGDMSRSSSTRALSAVPGRETFDFPTARAHPRINDGSDRAT